MISSRARYWVGPLLGSLARWRRNFAIGASEQAVSSSLGFVAQIIIVRSISPTEYGIFAVAWAAQTLAQTAINSVLAEPMGTVAIREHGRAGPHYLAQLLILNLLLSVAFGIVLAVAGAMLFIGGGHLGPALIASAVAMPSTGWFVILRSASYVNGKPSIALRASLGMAVTLAIGTVAMRGGGNPSASAGLVLLGVMSLGGAGCLAAPLGVTPRVLLQEARIDALSSTLLRHWHSGQWLILNGGALQVSRGLCIPFVAALVSFEAAAVCRAVATLMLPLQKMTELSIMLLHPFATARVSIWSRHAATAFIFKMSVLSGGGAIIYAIAVSLAGPEIMRLLYVHDYYVQSAWFIPVFSLCTVLISTTDPAFNIVFRALNRFECVFWGNAAGAVAFLAFGPLLTFLYGLAGAGIALTMSGLATSVCCALLLLNVTRLPVWRDSHGYPTSRP